MLLQELPVQKLVKIGWLGLLREWVKYNCFACSFFLVFTNSPTAQTERPTEAYYIPEDVA
jgi:hypothetical protein